MLTSKKKPIEHKTSEAVKMCVPWGRNPPQQQQQQGRSLQPHHHSWSEKKGWKSHWKRSLGCEMRAEWKDSLSVIPIRETGNVDSPWRPLEATTILQDVSNRSLEWFCVIKYALKRLCARCFAKTDRTTLWRARGSWSVSLICSICVAEEGFRRSEIRKFYPFRLSRQSSCNDMIKT